MSVTFSPQYLPTGRFFIVDENFDTGEVTRTGPFDNYQSASAEFVVKGYTYVNNDIMGARYVSIVGEDMFGDSAEVNMANANAASLFIAMGLDPEDCFSGTMDPQDMRDALLPIMAIQDPGTDTVEYQGEGGASIVDCGRRAGQFNRYADALQVVIDQAIARNVKVQWG